MDYVIVKHLDNNVLTDEKEYFFTSLTDRFEYANVLWAKALERRFGRKFEPIYIQNCKQNKYFKKKNYIIINKTAIAAMKNFGKKNIILLEDYEDLNKELSESATVRNLASKLIRKQGRVFVLGFTSSFLNFNNAKIKVLGPKAKIVTKVDNKIEHIKIFKKLNLPRNTVRIYSNLKQLATNEKYPYYISAAYTSGGYESGPIRNREDLRKFEKKLRNINKSNLFLVARLIEDIKSSPNVNALVYGKNKTTIVCISDQILNGNVYLGNIYPSEANKENTNAIIKITKTIGNYLSRLGFRGLFGLDFIIDSKNKIYTVDLNPRRQGGYMCNILMTKRLNLVDLELRALFDEIPKLDYNDFKPDFAWAHSKIKPHNKNLKILKTFKKGDFRTPFDKRGAVFECIFYPKNYLAVAGNYGYVIVSGNSRREVEDKIDKETRRINYEAFGEKD